MIEDKKRGYLNIFVYNSSIILLINHHGLHFGVELHFCHLALDGTSIHLTFFCLDMHLYLNFKLLTFLHLFLS